MENELQFLECKVTIVFDEINDVRSYATKFDKDLDKFFDTPANMFSVGDDVDPTVPRFRYTSKHKHSLLHISSVAAEMFTRFKGDEFSSNIDSIIDYCKQREKFLESAINENSKKIKFVGFMVKMQKEFGNLDFSDASPAKFVASKFLKPNVVSSSNTNKLEDASFRVSFAYDDRYFANIQVSNYKSFGQRVFSQEDGTVRIVTPSLKDLDFLSQGVEISLDINNRLLYDRFDENGHKDDDFVEVLNLAKNYVDKEFSLLI